MVYSKVTRRQLKKEYKIGDTASLRLTEVSGATKEVINWINSVEGKHLSADIIDAIKFKIALEQHYTKSQIKGLLQGVNAGTILTDKHKDGGIHTNGGNEEKNNKSIAFDKNVKSKNIQENYEDELFNESVTEKQAVNEGIKPINQGMKAFGSIKRSSKK